MLKRFLIAIRKPIIISRGTLMLEDSEYIKEEERLTNKLMRRVVILRITGSEVVVPLDGMYKKIRNTKEFYNSSAWRYAFSKPTKKRTLCKCDNCSREEFVGGNYDGRNCLACGGILKPIGEVKQ